MAVACELAGIAIGAPDGMVVGMSVSTAADEAVVMVSDVVAGVAVGKVVRASLVLTFYS